MSILPNKDQVEGKVKQTEGRAQDVRGDVTENTDDKLAGKAKNVEGKIQEAVGDVKKAIHDATR